MARNPLSLHQLNALDVGPVELIGFAARLGVPYVCLFTYPQPNPFPAVTAENEAAVAEALKAGGVALHNTEYVSVNEGFDFTGLPQAFARGRRLGAQRMTVHVHDTQQDRALETFATVCRLARDEDQEINLEWTAVNRAVGSLPQAVRFLELADQPNATLAVDLLHLTRSGGRPEEVAALPPRLARYAQISDGPLHRPLEEYGAVELVVERLPPGDGEFPTAAFVAALPPDVVVEVEAPQSKARDAGVSPFERARRSVEGARRFLS